MLPSEYNGRSFILRGRGLSDWKWNVGPTFGVPQRFNEHVVYIAIRVCNDNCELSGRHLSIPFFRPLSWQTFIHFMHLLNTAHRHCTKLSVYLSHVEGIAADTLVPSFTHMSRHSNRRQKQSCFLTFLLLQYCQSPGSRNRCCWCQIRAEYLAHDDGIKTNSRPILRLLAKASMPTPYRLVLVLSEVMQ